MSSIRQLKKEIDNQIFEIISDCFLYTSLHPDDLSEEISSIIEDAVTLRNDLIARTNNRASSDNSKDIRKHFKAVTNDLTTGVNELCGRLSKVTARKKKK